MKGKGEGVRDDSEGVRDADGQNVRDDNDQNIRDDNDQNSLHGL